MHSVNFILNDPINQMRLSSIAIKTLFQFAVIKSMTIQEHHKDRDEENVLNTVTNRLFTLAKICYSYISDTNIFTIL